MKDLKVNSVYILIIVLLLICSIMSVGLFRYGFFTAYDEAYFLLKLQEAYDMSCVTGKSQWNLIAIHWFPYLDLTSKVNSYIASSILIWLSIILMTITASILYDKKKIVKYFALIFLVYFTTGQGLSYVPMQTAVLSWAFCAFMLFMHFERHLIKCLCSVACGICLGLSCFIIIPAALAILASVAVMMVIQYWKSKGEMLKYLVSILAGVVLSVIYIHLVVCDIHEIYKAMLFTASYIGKSGYSYDGMSFITRYSLFARDFIFVVVTIVGAFWLSEKSKNKYIRTLIYVAVILLYNKYQVKPQFTNAMFLASLALIPFLFGHKSAISAKIFSNRIFYLKSFIFLFPFIACLGTNTTIGGRMSAFIFPWLCLFFENEQINKSPKYDRVLIGAIVLYIIPLLSIPKEFAKRDESYHFTRGNKHFASIALQRSQKEYFDKVYDILENYDFTPKQSVVLTAAFDYCCLYAFDAVNSSNYHQIQNFAYFPKDKMLKPDFIFLCKWDSIVMADDLRKMPWGWPDEFDEYYVGTPEPSDAPWVLNPELETRKLYCRKLKSASMNSH